MTADAILAPMKTMLDLHRTLLETSEGKRQAILGNQVSELAGWVNKETRLMKQVSEAQKQWRTAIMQFLVGRGMMPRSSITLDEIAELVEPEETRIALLDLQRQLMDLLLELKERNANNQQLIEKSLDYVNYSLDLVYGASGQDVVYGNPVSKGNANGAAQRYFQFDTRA